MEQTNQWLQCLNCQYEYSTDNVLYKMGDVFCPSCNSRSYIETDTGQEFSETTYMDLNESLKEDGEWN